MKISNKKQPLVCIVMLNWNGGETAWNCINSLIKKTNYKNYNVILVDNGSTDGSPERIVKRFKQVDLLKNKENLGYTRGMNSGWNYSINKYNPKYICDMNNDTITIQKEWLSLMVKELEKEKSRGLCANKQVFPNNNLQIIPWGADQKYYNKPDKGQMDFIREYDAVGGAILLIKRDVIKKIGGLDENFFYGPDDIDFCYRANKAGFKIIYTGFSKSIHISGFSYLSSAKDFIYQRQSYGMMLFSFRYGTLKEKFIMTFNQLIRAFVIRKIPSQKIELKNIHFQKTFIFRLCYFLMSLFKAIKDYKTIKNAYLNVKK